MSILITGLKMPTEGTFTIVHIYSDGHVSMPFWGEGMQMVEGINAISVPHHGRLIDADALMDFVPLMDGIKIENAPTIIDAEENE